MSALDSGALLIQYGNLFIGDDEGSAVNVGALRNVRFSTEPVTVTVNSDNRGELFRKTRFMGIVEADLLEVGNMAVLENIFKGLITLTSTPGTIVNNAPQVVASGDWSYDLFIPFENQNADGTCPTIDSVVLGTDGALVLNTDYHKAKDPATGKWGITIRDSSTVTTEAQAVTITTDYTPAISRTLTGGSSQTATPRYVRIEGPDEDDSETMRIVVLEESIASSPLLIPFVEVESAGDVGVMPLRMESRKGSTWTLTDEINPT